MEGSDTLNLSGLRKFRVSPQVLVRSGSRFVVDASEVAKQKDASTGLVMFPIKGVFTDPKTVFLGFGIPNTYLVVPRENGDPKGPGWNRFAAFMLWRKSASIEDTNGCAQAGIQFELHGLPAEVVAGLRAAMEEYAGKRYPSCARVNSMVLKAAGFTCGGKPIKRVYRPSKLASRIWRHGLELNDVPVDIRVIQTGGEVTDHFVSVWGKEVSSLYRLVKKLFHRSGDESATPTFDLEFETDPATTPSQSARQITIGISRPSLLGAHLGAILGQHPIFVAEPQTILDAPELVEPLRSFPGRLSTISKLKKYVLFSRPAVWFIRHHLMTEVEYYPGVPLDAVANMLRSSVGPNADQAFKYNIVMTGERIYISRLENRNGRDRKRINWVLAKHVLIAGYDPDVRFSGEIWKYVDTAGQVTIYMNADSGTYKPGTERLEPAVRYVNQTFGVAVQPVFTR